MSKSIREAIARLELLDDMRENINGIRVELEDLGAVLAAKNATIRELAEGLLSIAETAMPESYLESDSRCVAARAALTDIAGGGI